MAESTAPTSTTPKAPVSVTMAAGGSSKINLSPNGNLAVFVQGRIDRSERVAQTRDSRPIFETVVFLPAVDAYSHPKRYCISSYGPIGRPGDDVAIECEIVCQPWKPRSQGNANNGGNNYPSGPYNDGYAGGNYQGNNNSNSGRWRYPHYLWVIA